MKFYNRESELKSLKQLDQLSRLHAHFTVITGKRRVGKTTLVKEVFQNRKNVFYFFVSKKSVSSLLDEFRDVLAAQIPLASTVSFSSIDSFLRFIFEYSVKEHITIIFDEFQQFLETDRSIFSIFQKQWDEYKGKMKCHLICVGSVFTLMKKIFEDEKEPLFGRATAKIHLKNFDVGVISNILRDYGELHAKRFLFFYTLFGGCPKYYEILEYYQLFQKTDQKICRELFFSPHAPLKEEGKNSIIEEFGKNAPTYFSILQAVSKGESQMSRIADKAKVDVKSVSKYLDDLCNYYQLIDREFPILYSSGKFGLYFLNDQFLQFWFRYFYSNQSLFYGEENERLLAFIQKDISNLYGFTFEKLVRETLIYLKIKQKLFFDFDEIGRFWMRNREQTEIDIVASLSRKKAVFFECKVNAFSINTQEIQKFLYKVEKFSYQFSEKELFFCTLEKIPQKIIDLCEKYNIRYISFEELMP